MLLLRGVNEPNACLELFCQWLDDHCHMPTILKLPRDTMIVAGNETADILKPLGFSNIRILDHDQTIEVANGRLRITAVTGETQKELIILVGFFVLSLPIFSLPKGALVGPPWSKRQNGYAFKETASKDGASASLFYEPHCDFDESSVSKVDKIDVVVSPVKSTLLGANGISYPLVLGDINLMKLIKLLRPKVQYMVRISSLCIFSHQSLIFLGFGPPFQR
jgi:hypothetical protein